MEEQPGTIDRESIEYVSLVAMATEFVSKILTESFKYSESHRAVIVYDTQSLLSCVLSDAYKKAIPNAICIDFDTQTQDAIVKSFETLGVDDFVGLIQSSNFRLDDFRIRVQLFAKGIKVIEHVHLYRMIGVHAQWYIESLAYDQNYYHTTGRGLKKIIDSAQSGYVESGGETLHFGSTFETAMMNIGDYQDMKNVGGLYPIGEVFTESQVLEEVHGRARIFLFADVNFAVTIPETPIVIIIEEGRIVATEHSTPEFDAVLAMIKRHEGEVWVRELGFGLNRAYTKEKIVPSIGAYERMCGVHLSLGKKHNIYNKPEYFRRKDARYHIDVFIDTHDVVFDTTSVFKDGAWVV